VHPRDFFLNPRWRFFFRSRRRRGRGTEQARRFIAGDRCSPLP
jgi:hypothetical protein